MLQSGRNIKSLVNFFCAIPIFQRNSVFRIYILYFVEIENSVRPTCTKNSRSFRHWLSNTSISARFLVEIQKFGFSATSESYRKDPLILRYFDKITTRVYVLLRDFLVY